jgi:AcrR family transcriptional regulator
MAGMSSTTRTRNRRGEGERLRGEIVSAAADLLEATGDEGAITLRAVARRAGITAPSIYAHFDGREAILEAVVAEAFPALAARLRAASEAEDDPVARLRAGCAAYLAFASEQPQRYRVLFQRRQAPDAPKLQRAESIEEIAGAEAFGWLVEAIRDCAEAGRSTTPSALDSAVQLWVALHGYATLRAAANDFPWPDADALLDALISRLAYIDPPDSTKRSRRSA